MGYEAHLDLRDDRGTAWIGVHTPACADLSPLFTSVLSQGSLTDDFEALLQYLPPGARVIERLGPRAVALNLEGSHERLGVVLKLVPPSQRGAVDALLHLADGSRARRAHLMAHRVRAFGVSTARPLGYLERRRGPRGAPSLCVTARLDGLALLDWYQQILVPMKRSARPAFVTAKRRRIREIAELLRILHAQGLFHADLHAENLFVTNDGVCLIDLESMRTVARPSRIVAKGFVRLNRDFLDPDSLGVRDRMRLLSIYTRHEADARSRRRQLWQQVAAGTARKLIERGESFAGS